MENFTITFCANRHSGTSFGTTEEIKRKIIELIEENAEKRIRFYFCGNTKFDHIMRDTAANIRKSGKYSFDMIYVSRGEKTDEALTDFLYDGVVVPDADTAAKRTKWIIDCADAVFACIGVGGAAAKAVEYAKKRRNKFLKPAVYSYFECNNKLF